MLYAILNPETGQMVGAPQTLPVRWTTPEGATIGSFNVLPAAVLASLHWLPVEYEALPSSETHRHAPFAVYDADNARFVYRAVAIALGTLQADACTAIDAAASDASARHLSQGTGMELRYMDKLVQARDAVLQLTANPDADTSPWPLVVAEAAAVGETVLERAQTILAAYAAWATIAAQIEAARIGGKTAVMSATTAEAVIEARDEALQALESL